MVKFNLFGINWDELMYTHLVLDVMSVSIIRVTSVLKNLASLVKAYWLLLKNHKKRKHWYSKKSCYTKPSNIDFVNTNCSKRASKPILIKQDFFRMQFRDSTLEPNVCWQSNRPKPKNIFRKKSKDDTTWYCE